jgi:FAD/FMN-containing dehydrogenase
MARRPSEEITDAVTRITSTLRTSFQGEVIAPIDPAYDEARRVWNGLIDRRPGVIARCAAPGDAVEAVRLAARHRPPVSIRGGGHQVAGSAVCDDGLVIDLSRMRRVEVDPEARVARVEGGATWGDVDRATQRYGLATTGGEVSTTGVAGFTLGGGMGLFMRRHGLACDNLRAIEIVTADGELRRADAETHSDLLWAARGGGRGIGVVTALELDLHPLGPEVAVAQVMYPYDQAERILEAWPELALSAPDTVTPQLILWSVPPAPEIPEELHGLKTVIAVGLYAGDPGEAEEALAPIRDLGDPLVDLSGTLPYVDLQSSVDDLFPTGGRYFMKSHFMETPGQEAIRTVLEWDARRPTPESLVVLRTMGGAVSRVRPEETAFPHRIAPFNLSIDAGWTDPTLDEEGIGWARRFWDAMKPHAEGGVYVNFSGLDDEAEAMSDSIYGASVDRLSGIRRRYDPEGVFEGAAKRP